jgi:hypothetical protein
MDEWQARRRAEWAARVEASLAKCDEALIDAEIKREQRWQRGEPEVKAAPPAERTAPVQPMYRRTGLPRDWHAEQKWVEQIIAQEIAAYNAKLVDAVGFAIAHERRDYDAELAKLRAEVEALRASLQREDAIDGRGVSRLEALVGRLEAIDIRLRRVAGDDDLIDITPAKPH